MIPIADLISIQSSSDCTAFIGYLEKRNKRHDTRNVDLYQAFLKGEEKAIAEEIGKNAFNALKKRLTDQLIDFSASKFLTSMLSVENKVIKLIVISRRLLSTNHIHTGYALLGRAEKLADELDHFSLLNEIYHTAIEYSHKSEKIDQNALFQKLEKNNTGFITQERLSILYASMHRQFNYENFKVLPTSLHDLYDKGLATFGINSEMALNFRSLNQLCVLTDLYGSQTKNYNQLDLFFEDMIGQLQGSSKDSEKMLGYHIETLYVMANIYFRRREPKKSLFYLDQMKVQMARYNGKLQNVWRARRVNLYALLLNFSSNHAEAAQQIEECLESHKMAENESALLQLTLFMIRFQQGNLKEAKTIIAAFQRSDKWYLNHMGNEWLFNLKAMEVLLHIDLGNDQLAESKILSFQRKYAQHFKKDVDNPLWPFLILVKSILFHSEDLHTPEFSKKLESTIPWKGEQEDFFNVCFYGWLKAKMLKNPVYETTLDLLDIKVVL